MSNNFLDKKRFHLHSTVALEDCIRNCWKEEIYLQPLCPKFWRLTLQMFSRYSTWIHDLYQNEVRLFYHFVNYFQNCCKEITLSWQYCVEEIILSIYHYFASILSWWLPVNCMCFLNSSSLIILFRREASHYFTLSKFLQFHGRSQFSYNIFLI